MRSSGQVVIQFDLEVACENEEDGCKFEGTVQAWEDREVNLWGWTCPECGYDHEESALPDDTEPDWDAVWYDGE